MMSRKLLPVASCTHFEKSGLLSWHRPKKSGRDVIGWTGPAPITGDELLMASCGCILFDFWRQCSTPAPSVTAKCDHAFRGHNIEPQSRFRLAGDWYLDAQLAIEKR